MTFFNTKEEVVNIELTPYGKYLLSRGKWKPAYYEFYDDDVVYDSEYSGFTEGQDKIQERIKSTKRTKVQYSFSGADVRYKEYVKQTRERKNSLKNSLLLTLEKRKNFSLTSLPLANSKMSRDKMPAWAIDVHRGKIEQFNTSVDIIGLPNNLYSLKLQDTLYTLLVKNLKEQTATTGLIRETSADRAGQSIFSQKEFEDGSYIEVLDDYLLLDIKEENVDLLSENFDMFLYLVETDPKTGEEIEKPLRFVNKKSKVINGVLVDDDSLNTGEADFALGEINEARPSKIMNPEYANYYFNIYLDKEISTEALGKYLTEADKNLLTVSDGYKFYDRTATAKAIQLGKELPSVTPDDVKDFEDC